MQRCVIYLSDHAIITGKSNRQAQRDFKKMRQKLNINNVNYVGVSSYLSYTGLSKSDIEKALTGIN